MANETIFATATAPGKSGVAVIRLSGAQSWNVVERLAGDIPVARTASLRTLRGDDGEVLDEALVICFAERASFTGEEAAELQVHGSVAVIRAVLDAIGQTGLARPAAAGEFTRRALENDRLDLTQVQGLADIIDAETELQRTMAMRVMRGELSDRVLGWKATLLRATALIEATIDFADEDVPEDVSADVDALLAELETSFRAELAGSDRRERLRVGFDVAIIGEPNAGKSSLLNALAGSDVAIVTDRPGTTRDLIEKYININGLPINFIDTAGLRATTDPVERIGVTKAMARAETADLRVFLYDGLEQPNWPIAVEAEDIVLRSKSDLQPGADISARTGEGLDDLISTMSARLWQRDLGDGLIARKRDVELVAEAQALIGKVRGSGGPFDEIAAEELRRAARRLQAIIGGVEVEDVLGEIFSSFCIGK